MIERNSSRVPANASLNACRSDSAVRRSWRSTPLPIILLEAQLVINGLTEKCNFPDISEVRSGEVVVLTIFSWGGVGYAELIVGPWLSRITGKVPFRRFNLLRVVQFRGFSKMTLSSLQAQAPRDFIRLLTVELH